ncbi:MAG: MDR family MFS transporter [Vulcanimicrobiaceae bacterium]
MDTVESGARKWIVAFGIALAPLLETIDSTIVNVALPNIQGNLGASLDEAAFIITGYLAANVVVIPLTPWFAERLGRRQYLTMSIAGFTLVSILCGFAPSIGALVALRVVQGFFGGGLIATVQAALRDLFPPEEANIGQAIFGVVIACGPILGPLFGGIIVDNASWPWIFFVNLVPGLISGTVAATMLKNPAQPRKVPVDLSGIALLTVGIATLEYVLEEGERNDWFADERIAWLALLSCVSLVAFVVHSLRGTRQPIVDLRVLRDRNVWVGCVLAAGFGITLIGLNFILPQYLQSAIAFTPTLSGQYLLFRGVPIVALAPAIGIALGANRFDPRLLIGFGFLATGLGTGWIGTMTTSQSDFGTLVWPLVLAGVGTAFLIIPLLTVVLAGVSNAIAPKASAFLTLSVQLGGSISSAFVVTLLDRRESVHSNTLAATATLRHQALAGSVDTQTLARIVGGQAAVQSYADIAYVVAALAFALVPCVFVVRRPPPGPLSVAAE